MNPEEIKILICCHKQCDLPEDKFGILLPIHVGAANSSKELTYLGNPMQRDDQVNGEPCDNISIRNKNYCELTALYWAWKNIKILYPNLKYVGLNHYRRYFAFDKKIHPSEILKNEDFICTYSIDQLILKKILQKKNVVLAKQHVLSYSVETDYCEFHNSDDSERLYKTIQKLSPEYLPAYYRTWLLSNKFSCFNMFIMPWNLFDEYCSWLFCILGKLENETDISHYDDYQKRIYGFMAERLLNTFIDKKKTDNKNLRIEYKSVYFCNDEEFNISKTNQGKGIIKILKKIYKFYIRIRLNKAFRYSVTNKRRLYKSYLVHGWRKH